MATNPRISIISPCYNHGQYIQEMLGSVFGQTFQAYEVIIVNDGSTDETKEILDSLHHEKLTIIHTPNHGPAAARNMGVAAARAPLILNLDADDKIAPTFLEKAHKIFEANPSVGIVYSDQRFFGNTSGKFDLRPYSLAAMLNDNVIPSQAFFKKSDWEVVGGYSEEFIYGLEDYDFWLSIIELGREVYRIPEPLVFYRRYKNPEDCRSERRKQSRKRSITAMLTILHRHPKLYERCPEAKERMILLERKWERENFIIRELKEFYHYIMYRLQYRKWVMD
jgi:glycosyltransferase involved in cell wall biosynthesis